MLNYTLWLVHPLTSQSHCITHSLAIAFTLCPMYWLQLIVFCSFGC
jgi:hypothetical protein